jgi:8-oxo-dGTP pyrophosphatase MutT (NUDIX family)
MDRPTVPTGAAAKALGIGKVTLLRWMHAGQVTPAWTTPAGQFRWDVDDLRRQLSVNAGGRNSPQRGQDLPPDLPPPPLKSAITRRLPAAPVITPATPEPQPVVAVVVASRLGVLVTKRVDGKPPWGFVGGEIEPGESPADAAIREMKEETGLTVRPGLGLDRRVHPDTGRLMIYVSAEVTGDLDIHVGDPAELEEVCWVTLTQARKLMPKMWGPAHAYLVKAAGRHRQKP